MPRMFPRDKDPMATLAVQFGIDKSLLEKMQQKAIDIVKDHNIASVANKATNALNEKNIPHKLKPTAERKNIVLHGYLNHTRSSLIKRLDFKDHKDETPTRPHSAAATRKEKGSFSEIVRGQKISLTNKHRPKSAPPGGRVGSLGR